LTIQRIIDAHVHQWDLRNTPRETSPFVKLLGWNRPLMYWFAKKVFPKDAVDFFGGPDEVLSNYLPLNYTKDSENMKIDGFIHIEASWLDKDPMGSVAETQWLESLNTPLLKAIVGFADLRLGDKVEEILHAHLATSSRFRGIRYALTHHPKKSILNACEDPDLMNDATWRKGYAKLAPLGLSFDATVYHHQLDNLTSLAQDFPDVQVILCHAGTPTGYGGPFGGEGQTIDERNEIANTWRKSMSRLAELPNINVKISGLAMPILGWDYHRGNPDANQVAEDFRPIVDFIIDTFGADRCMFASNFPVDRISMPWATLFDSFNLTVENRSEAERQALFYGTAARVYSIEDTPGL